MHSLKFPEEIESWSSNPLEMVAQNAMVLVSNRSFAQVWNENTKMIPGLVLIRNDFVQDVQFDQFCSRNYFLSNFPANNYWLQKKKNIIYYWPLFQFSFPFLKMLVKDTSYF